MASSAVLEVEEKFALGSLTKVEDRLEELGFNNVSRKSFVDWYFDTESGSLLSRDNWMRYREVENSKGQWQLKSGANAGDSDFKSTVYSEIEGDDALHVIKQIFDKNSFNSRECEPLFHATFDNHHPPAIPSLMDGYELLPFARIATTRSSWQSGGTGSLFIGLSVDLDTTDFGYSVGEVEAVVKAEEEVEAARELITTLVSRINEESTTKEPPAVGKLEFYLERNQLKLYQACIGFGVIKSKG